MIRPLFGSLLLACAFGAAAQDWQRDFHDTHLPHERSLVVDNLGQVHVQAHHPDPWIGSPGFASRLDIAPDGAVRWRQGWTPLDRTPECGLFAGNRQALDCFRTAVSGGERTALEMRARDDDRIVWQNVLPPEFRLLAGAIPAEDQALLVAEMPDHTGHHGDMGVFSIDRQGVIDIRSIAPSCPGGARLMAVRFRMPEAPGDAIRAIKICRQLYGATELRLESFAPAAMAWQPLLTLPLPFEMTPTHVEINDKGHAFVLVDGPTTGRHLFSSDQDDGRWRTMFLGMLPPGVRIHSMQVNVQALVLVTDNFSPTDDTVDTTVRIDLQQDLPPQVRHHPELREIRASAFALSNSGRLVILGTRHHPGEDHAPPDSLWYVHDDGWLQPLATLQTWYGDMPVGIPRLHVTPDHAAVVARTYRNPDFYGDPDMASLRIRRVPLPMHP